jgi:peptidylprolyl isomerase
MFFMDKKLLALIGILIIVLAGFYITSTQGQNMNKSANNPTATPSAQPQSSDANTAPSGLIVEDIKLGGGKEVRSGDTIVIHYTGTLQNGEKFDSSVDRGQPFTTKIGVGEVIKGWDEGVLGMKVGGKRKLTIPPDIGYGSSANGPIPANSTLIFELELLEVK